MGGGLVSSCEKEGGEKASTRGKKGIHKRDKALRTAFFTAIAPEGRKGYCLGRKFAVQSFFTEKGKKRGKSQREKGKKRRLLFPGSPKKEKGWPVFLWRSKGPTNGEKAFLPGRKRMGAVVGRIGEGVFLSWRGGTDIAKTGGGKKKLVKDCWGKKHPVVCNTERKKSST